MNITVPANPPRELRHISIGPAPTLPLVAALLILAAAAIPLVLWLEWWAVAVPVYGAAFVSAVLWPRHAALALAAVLIAIEPEAFDFTKALSTLIYFGPPDIDQVLPLTISPAEVMLVFASGAAFIRQSERRRYTGTPWLAAAVPLVIAIGMAYGLAKGAPSNLAYHEARGLIFGVLAFLLAPTLTTRIRSAYLVCLIAGAAILGAITITRYLMYVRYGQLPVAAESAFAHDSVIYMMLAASTLITLLIARRGRGYSWLMLLGVALFLIAIVMTGRRSGTLVGIVGIVVVLTLLYPYRKALVLTLSAALLAFMAVYLAAFWNTEYGAMAQPARAVRSQFDPSARDESSDIYRDIEKYDLKQTIRTHPVFGVGFGNQFYQFQPLPDLTDFWPLQLYTPHQNVLWLWLKLGIAGIAVVIGTFALALTRSLRSLRKFGIDHPLGLAAIVSATGLLMFLCFATVDLVFPSTRGMVVLGLIFSLAFQLHGHSHDDGTEAAPAEARVGRRSVNKGPRKGSPDGQNQ